jgi:hypothetical protein
MVAANEVAHRGIGPGCTFAHTHRHTPASHQPELDIIRCMNMDTVFGLNTWMHMSSSRKAPWVDISVA